MFAQQPHQLVAVGVETDQFQRSAGLGVRVLAEDELDTDEVRELSEIGGALRAEQHRGVERAARAAPVGR